MMTRGDNLEKLTSILRGYAIDIVHFTKLSQAQ
jgi:hypothetical protein